MDLQTQRLIAAAGGASDDPIYIDQLFHMESWKGAGAARTVNTGIDLATEGGLIWSSGRSQGTQGNVQVDSERGSFGKILYSNSTNAEGDTTVFGTPGTSSYVAANSYGTNWSGDKWIHWTFRKCPHFFDVVKYTGNGNNNAAGGQSVSHNLGSKPGLMIVKDLDNATNWFAWSDYFSGGNIAYQYFDDTNEELSDTNIWASTKPNATHFKVGGSTGFPSTNQNGVEYVAYLFGDNKSGNTFNFGETKDKPVIRCGSYTGNGNRTNINLGWEPQWIMIKKFGDTGQWMIFDSLRGLPGQAGNSGESEIQSTVKYLYADAASAEQTNDFITSHPTGFTLYNSDNETNASQSYHFVAIRRPDHEVGNPEITAATEIFDISQGNGSTSYPAFTSTCTPDMALTKKFAHTHDWKFINRLMPQKMLRTNERHNQEGESDALFDMTKGCMQDQSSDYQAWMWKRHKGAFDIQLYEGSGSAGNNISHQLGVTPEMIWIKQRDDDNTPWIVGHHGMNAASSPWNYHLYLDDSHSQQAENNTFNNTAPGSTSFQLGNGGGTNEDGHWYVACLFASLDGFSKVGYYTGDGTSNRTITLGFEPRFLILKAITDSDNWMVFDTVRGWTTTQQQLSINTGSSQDSRSNWINKTATGLTIANSYFNTDTKNFIYYAHA